MYIAIKPPVPFVSERDNIIQRYLKKDFPNAGQTTMVQRTIVHKDFPFNAEGVTPEGKVRSNMKQSVLFEKVDAGMKMTVIMTNNPGGSIP